MRGHGEHGALMKQLDQFLLCQRVVEVIALPQIAAALLQNGDLLLQLDALRHDVDAVEVAAHLRQIFQNDLASGVADQVIHETFVKLHLIETNVVQNGDVGVFDKERCKVSYYDKWS